MYRSAGLLALVPPAVLTRTSTWPAPGPAGAVTVHEVAVHESEVAGRPGPKVTPVVPARLVPVMVTTVPPASGPEFGPIEVTVGAAA